MKAPKYKLKGRNIMLENGRYIPSYPKLRKCKIQNGYPTLEEFENGCVCQYKYDGYNIRIVYLPYEGYDYSIWAFLRGGHLCEKTTKLLNKYYKDELYYFFEKYPNITICAEAVGKQSINTHHWQWYEQQFGFGNFGFKVFDLMNSNGLLSELNYQIMIKQLPSKFVTEWIHLKPEAYGDYLFLDSLVNKEAIEGIVIKSYQRDKILKFRWEYSSVFSEKRKELFKSYRPKKAKKPREKTKGEIIFEHFIQGYSEKELNLDRGINESELSELKHMLEKLRNIARHHPQKIPEVHFGYFLCPFLYQKAHL